MQVYTLDLLIYFRMGSLQFSVCLIPPGIWSLVLYRIIPVLYCTGIVRVLNSANLSHWLIVANSWLNYWLSSG